MLVGAGAAAQLLGGFAASLNEPIGLMRNAISDAVRVVAANPATSNTKPLIPLVLLITLSKVNGLASDPLLAKDLPVSNAASTPEPSKEDRR